MDTELRDQELELPELKALDRKYALLARKLNAAEAENRALKARVERAQKALESIVVTEGCDAGVVLLSADNSPKTFDKQSQSWVYDLEYFSPLGEALMTLYKNLNGSGTASELRPDDCVSAESPVSETEPRIDRAEVNSDL